MIFYIYVIIGILEFWLLGDNWENFLVFFGCIIVIVLYDLLYYMVFWVLGKMVVLIRVYVVVFFVMIYVYVGYRGKENNLLYLLFNVGKFMYSI